MTTQKLAEKLFLSVPTMLKVLKECEEWLEVYHISLVNEKEERDIGSKVKKMNTGLH